LLTSPGASVSQQTVAAEPYTYVPSPASGVNRLTSPAAQADLGPSAAAAPSGSRPRFARESVYRRSLAIADAAAAASALVLWTSFLGNRRPALATLAAGPLIVVISNLLGMYQREELLVHRSTLDEVPVLLQLAALYTLVVWLIEGVVLSGAREQRDLVVMTIALFVLLVLFRAMSRSLSRHVTTPERCLVIGDAAACTSMQRKLARGRSLHAVVVACVVAPNFEPHQQSTRSLPDTGSSIGTDDFSQFATRLGIDRIIVTPSGTDEEAMIHMVHAATSLGLRVSVLPRVLEVVGPSSEFDDVEGVPLLSIRPLGLKRSSRVLKRTLDIVAATFGLLFLAPFLVALAVAIKLDSRGPLLFRQLRVGHGGKPFHMLKFRTMVRDADEKKGELQHLNEADGLFKIAGDPRITRVGRLLRRTSVDELPQLLNVLRGEMSLVGPRPLVPEEDSRIEGWRRRRLHLTPGLTGHWQVLGSARIPLEEMARIDYLYVTSWSLWLDVKILLRTVPYVLSGKGM
jgi:exopolysaccharide biosynthesis polyprenyl glycosylphosphotransferase